MITIPARPCRSCGKQLGVNPFRFLVRAPAITCTRCGQSTQLSITVNLAGTALGFVLAAVVAGACLDAVQPADGGAMAMLPFLIVFALGIGAILATQMAFGSVCYLLASLFRRG